MSFLKNTFCGIIVLVCKMMNDLFVSSQKELMVIKYNDFTLKKTH